MEISIEYIRDIVICYLLIINAANYFTPDISCKVSTNCRGRFECLCEQYVLKWIHETSSEFSCR